MNCPLAIVTEVKKRKDTEVENYKKEESQWVLWSFIFIWLEKKKKDELCAEILGRKKKKDNCDLLGNSYCEQF